MMYILHLYAIYLVSVYINLILYSFLFTKYSYHELLSIIPTLKKTEAGELPQFGGSISKQKLEEEQNKKSNLTVAKMAAKHRAF